MADNALTINTGTALTMASDDISSVHYPRVKISLGADGAAADWTGNIPTGTITLLSTVTTVSNLTNGTVRMSVGTLTTGTLQNLVSGTINAIAAGTITNGTVSTIGLRHADEFATVISSGTSVLGTIRAAVSGSQIFVTSLVISAGSATNVEIASGGTSTPILGTMFFNSNSGAVLTPINPPIRTVAGSALVYKQSANGPLTITATGYID